MKLTPVKKTDVPTGRAKSSAYREILHNFIESGHEAAKLEGLPKRIDSAAAQLRRYAKKENLPVTVRVAGKELYLLKGSG